MKIEDIQQVLDQYPVLVGIDWADQKHDVFVYDTDCEEGENITIDTNPSDVLNWISELKEQYQTDRILVCMEANDTRLYHTLRAVWYVEIVTYGPDVLSSFRETFSPSGAQNDPTDARLQVQLYLTHPNEFTVEKADEESTRHLNNLVRKRRKLVDKRGDMENTMRDELKKYFPQALQLVGSSLHSYMACEFLQKWGSLRELREEDPDRIREFFRKFRLGEKRIQKRMELIKNAIQVTNDQAHNQPCKKMVQALADSIFSFTQTIKEYNEQLDREMDNHQDAVIWRSCPRAGQQLAPRLLAAFGDNRNRWENAEDIQELSGMAPVTVESGKNSRVHWRWMASKFMMQTFYEYAEQSRLGSAWAKAFYEMKKDQGDAHSTVIRKLAFKWIRIMYRCWMNEETYDESRYILALIQRDSPVVDYIDQEVIEKEKNNAA